MVLCGSSRARGSGAPRKWVGAVVLAGMLAAGLPAAAVPLITNGGFESGFTGWTVSDLGSGSFYIDDADNSTPSSGQTTAGPSSGAAYAVSDQLDAGTHALLQDFIVPGPASSVILSFAMFVNDWDSGPIVAPAGLDHTGAPNQHARVDILLSGAGDFDTGAGVLANYYIGVDPGADPNAYTAYLFDITSLVGAGGTFTLRFAETDNSGFLNLGVDDVSIEYTAAVPEPATFVSVGAALAVLAASRRRRG